jgi:hypothetical protein
MPPPCATISIRSSVRMAASRRSCAPDLVEPAVDGCLVATAAELCFMAQWALLLHYVAQDTRSRFAVVIPWFIVPHIAVAEVCSWYATLTMCYLGNVLDESIWTLSASLLVVGCIAVWPRCLAPRKRLPRQPPKPSPPRSRCREAELPYHSFSVARTRRVRAEAR